MRVEGKGEGRETGREERERGGYGSGREGKGGEGA